MKLFKQLGLIIAGLGMWLTPLVAEDVPGLYEAEVPVESQDREIREQAIRTALQQVLVRVTGRQLVLTVTAVEQALEQANRYVQQFRYRARESAREGEPDQVLWVRFDKQAVDRLLHDNRLPVWGRTRPATLVWMVVDDRQKRQLLSNDMDVTARKILEEQARLRGVPIRLPLMDLADRSEVGVSDVWGNFEDNLMQASARYQPEAVLVARVFKTYSNNWNARWTLYQDGRRQEWTASGEQLAEVITPGVNQLADSLAAQFARIEQTEGSNQLRVKVNRVQGLADYNRLLDYLNSLSPVSEVRVQQLEGDSVIVMLTSRRGPEAINQAVSLGHTLAAEAVSTPLPGTPDNRNRDRPAQPNRIDLQYHLLP